jgi:hypothetical protein
VPGSVLSGAESGRKATSFRSCRGAANRACPKTACRWKVRARGRRRPLCWASDSRSRCFWGCRGRCCRQVGVFDGPAEIHGFWWQVVAGSPSESPGLAVVGQIQGSCTHGGTRQVHTLSCIFSFHWATGLPQPLPVRAFRGWVAVWGRGKGDRTKMDLLPSFFSFLFIYSAAPYYTYEAISYGMQQRIYEY